MSALFNQTNISPGTAFASGGAVSGTILANNIVSLSNANNYINMNDANSDIRIATGNNSLILSYNTETDTRIEFIPTGGNSIGFYGTNTGDIWAKGNNLPGVLYGVAFNGISSINDNSATTGVINMSALTSTLKVAFPGCVS